MTRQTRRLRMSLIALSLVQDETDAVPRQVCIFYRGW